MTQVQKLQKQLNKYHQAGDFKKALGICRKIDALVGPHAEILKFMIATAQHTDQSQQVARFVAKRVANARLEVRVEVVKILMQSLATGAAIDVLASMPEKTIGDFDVVDTKRLALYLAGRYEEALPYMERYKDRSLKHMFEYAKCLAYVFDDRFFQAERVFDALTAASQDAPANLGFFSHFYQWIGVFDKARDTALQSARNQSDIAQNAILYQRAAQCAFALSDQEGLHSICAEAISVLGANRMLTSGAGQADLIDGYIAMFSYFQGEANWLDNIRSLPALASLDAQVLNNVPKTFPRKMKELKKKLAGQDVFIVMPGPSVKALGPLLPQLDLTNIKFATVNKISPVTNGILKGRLVDVFFSTIAYQLYGEGALLHEYLAAKNDVFFITDDYTMSALQHPPVGENYVEPMILPQRAETPVTPEHPLRLHDINGLAALLVLFVLTAPNEIFIFGADGASSETQDYFYTDYHAKDGEPKQSGTGSHRSEARNVRLSGDTMKFNLMMPFMLQSVCKLFGVDMPKITNVGLDSKLTPFEKISYEDALNALQNKQ